MRRRVRTQMSDECAGAIPHAITPKKKSRIALVIMGACYAVVIGFALISAHVWSQNAISIALHNNTVQEEHLADGTSVHHFDSGRQVVCRDGRIVGTNVPRLVRISPNLVTRICGAPTRS